MFNEIYCDGACNSVSGNMGWTTVTSEKGNSLLYLLFDEKDFEVQQVEYTIPKTRKVLRTSVIVCHFTDVKSQQNNGAELIGLVSALLIARKCKFYGTIYSDSKLMVESWSKGNITKKTKKNMDPKKLALINRCISLRNQFEKLGGKIEKISGDDNKADLGFHR